MKRSTKYVGLDVHQATTVVSVREQNGRVIARAILPTAAAGLVDFFGCMRGSVQVAFEEGTQAQWLHDVLVPVVDRVVVCDRRGQGRRGNKGDQGDADRLSHELRSGALRSTYHGVGQATLKELTRAYRSLVDDSTRVMLRLKAVYRARAIRTPGKRLYGQKDRAVWLGKLTDKGGRTRAELLYAELDVLRALRPKAKAAMVAEARRDLVWPVLRTIPFMGPVRAALLLATMQTPWRFRTKRSLWAYAGLSVVTHSSAEHEFVAGRAVRRRRAPLTRGLNPHHNRVLKNVFKGAALAAIGRPGPLQDFYRGMVARGMRPELARVTLARKLAAITLRLWKTGERYDSTKLTVQRT
jgi:transposase